MFLNIIISVNMKDFTIYLPFTKREHHSLHHSKKRNYQQLNKYLKLAKYQLGTCCFSKNVKSLHPLLTVPQMIYLDCVSSQSLTFPDCKDLKGCATKGLKQQLILGRKWLRKNPSSYLDQSSHLRKSSKRILTAMCIYQYQYH